MKTQVSFLDALPAADFGLCLSQHVSIEVNILLPGLNGWLSGMMLHLVAELRETSEETGSTVTSC